MKAFLFLLFALPTALWAQTDTLKPIEILNVPTYNYQRYGHQYGLGERYTGVGERYTYDGIEVRRPRDLAPYILASGDKNAIQDFQQYVRQRKLRNTMLVAGGSVMLLGYIVNRTTTRSNAATMTALSTLNPNTFGAVVNDLQRSHTTTVLTAGAGFVIGAIGLLATNPNFHLRRSIQYYNRALKQQGVSWRVSPYASLSHSGLGLTAQF